MLASGLLSGSVSIGAALLAMVLLSVAGYLAIRYKTAEMAKATAAEWRDNYLAERALNKSLQERYDEQRRLKHEAMNRALAAEGRSDLSEVFRALAITNATLGELRTAIAETEARTLTQLERIANTEEKIAAHLERLVPLP